MRDILVDRARARLSSKRGGDLVRVEESDQLVRTDADADEILAVDLALGELKRQSPRQAQLVVLRYYGGFTLAEPVWFSLTVADVDGLSSLEPQLSW